MIRTHKRGLILSSIAILLPMIVGLILWNRLPDQMVTHFGGDRVPDGTSGKAFAVFGLPVILLALHWLCVFITTKDPKNSGQNPKMHRHHKASNPDYKPQVRKLIELCLEKLAQ